MTPANFSFHDWEQRTDPKIYVVPPLNARDLPRPPDNYRPGHLSWGKNPARGRGIQRGRDKRRLAANKAFFLTSVLPAIESELNPAAWHDLGSQFNDPAFHARGGFVRYELGERAGWLHPELEPEKLARALEMGATPAT